MDFIQLVPLISILLFWRVFCVWADEDGCISPQYLEVGKSGTIKCSLEQPFFGLRWYNTTDTVHNSPILNFFEMSPSGEGYEAGDYDIYSNGSLKINNVSAVHDGNFTAVKLISSENDPVHYVVMIVTTVKPAGRSPYIEGCAHETNPCVLQVYNVSELTCLVRAARPAIKLQWVLRTPRGDTLLPSDIHFKEDWITVSTFATIKQKFPKEPVLNFLVCKAESLPDMLHNDEVSILVQNGDVNFSTMVPNDIFIQHGSRLEIRCPGTSISLVVWKKSTKPTYRFEKIAFGVLYGERASGTYFDDYELSSDGSLVIPKVDVKHEGLYSCLCENNVTGEGTLFDVTVYVPGFPSVDGCTQNRFCTLNVLNSGSITCFVNGVRPLVHLEVATVYEKDLNLVVFSKHEVRISSHGDVYDVYLTVNYEIKKPQTNRLTLECRISGSNVKALQTSRTFGLHIEERHVNDDSGGHALSQFLWLGLVIMPIGLVIVVIFSCRLVIKKGQRQQNLKMFANVNMEPSLHEKRNIFIRQLKGKYEDLYNAVHPIPYIRDRLFCIDRVFVEGGLEYLVSSDGSGNWEMLETYHFIFKPSLKKSTRCILEGKPGYGKSTLTLQFTYDWCNRTEHSPLKDVEILIFLRLRQLGRVFSIYQAIKQFILPRDSQLTAEAIETILTNTPSTVIILDGYDEYPDQNNTAADVNSIIRRQMFQDFDVILTTRSFCLPTKYAPQTKRVRLTGFNDQAQDAYIKKAFISNGPVAAEKIKQRLKKNFVVSELCQAPLFFVMFAHMSHESDEVLIFNSVTSFFRQTISCFHSHMKNKMEDDNVEQFQLWETDHQVLAAAAFKALSGKDGKIVWAKEELRQTLGENFYDQYISLGILVEKEILKIENIQDIRMNEHIQRKTEVRFYHKLFCEWYAAHFLSENARTLSSRRLRTFLRNVDPFDLQFLYRFACGLDPTAAKKIISHLRATDEGEKFARLCILEQTDDVEKITATVQVFCDDIVTIYNHQSRLPQRSTIQLLEIASRLKISISHVRLSNCYSTVNLSGGNHLQLKSNLSIPVLTTLKKLTICEEGREITAEEFAGILQYSSKCLALKELCFGFFLLPKSVQAETVSVLRSRNVEVVWDAPTCTKYQFNLHSCVWDHLQYLRGVYQVAGVMTDDDYQSEARKIMETREEN